MFDFGWSELLLIGIVALIVVGPKDLPVMFKAMGKFIGKIKAMGREFSRAMNDAADDTGVNDISKSLKAATNPQKFGIDKLREAANISPGSETDKLAKKREAERAAALAQASGSTETGLSEERAAATEKIRAKTAEAATARKAREAEAAAAAEAAADDIAPEAKPE